MTTETNNPSKNNIPDIRPGDTVKVYLKVEGGSKTKNQIFSGRVIAIKHGREPGATITVRRESKGTGADVAIEKIIPIYSPLVSKIEIVERKKVRRAKLYYLRNLTKKIHFKKGKEINKSDQREQVTETSKEEKNEEEEQISENKNTEDTQKEKEDDNIKQEDQNKQKEGE